MSETRPAKRISPGQAMFETAQALERKCARQGDEIAKLREALRRIGHTEMPLGIVRDVARAALAETGENPLTKL